MLTVATYNILHGYRTSLILDDIKILIGKGADVICLQEADLPFENPLNDLLKHEALKNWQVQYTHYGIAGNVALMWNSDRVKLQHAETILLPRLPGLSILQKLRGGKEILQRVALTGEFLVDGKIVHITGTHLAWEGGVKHRLKQLAYLRGHLSKQPYDREVLAGDFNTFAPAALRYFQGKKVQNILGERYINALPNLHWSCDISYTAPQDGWDNIVKVFNFFGIKMRSRLDYLFARNLKIISSEMLDLPGSDHRPLIATFKI